MGKIRLGGRVQVRNVIPVELRLIACEFLLAPDRNEDERSRKECEA